MAGISYTFTNCHFHGVTFSSKRPFEASSDDVDDGVFVCKRRADQGMRVPSAPIPQRVGSATVTIPSVLSTGGLGAVRQPGGTPASPPPGMLGSTFGGTGSGADKKSAGDGKSGF